MPGEKRLLIIAEGGQSINGLRSELMQKGFACSTAGAEGEVLKQIAEQAPDLVLMALNGHPSQAMRELPQRIKEQRPLPIMALVNKETLPSLEADPKMIDDFAVRPEDPDELELRIKRLLQKSADSASSELIRCGDLLIDLAKCEVSLRGRPIELTFKEYELLRFLAANQGRVFSRDTLLNRVWGYDYYGGDRTVDVHIRRLRSKIEDAGHTFIETVRNIGYRFRCPA
ncbi:MAG TPA: response regulator transcription factor [Dehalococcoidia bacterium]|jgi:DNA-binding response OmpR family regulator|nr:response regulator transcription factor [Dehalococcoidia bacterium]